MLARRLSFLALTALPLIACTQPAEDLGTRSSELAIPEPDVAFDPDLVVAPPPPDLAVSTLEIGDGWRRIRVAGKATDVDTSAVVAVDRELLVITDKTKVATAPVAKFVKSEIQAELAAPKTAKFLAAGALPEGEEADIIDVRAAAAAETAMNSGTPSAFFSCSSEEKTFSKTLSTTKTYSDHKTSEPGKLTGSLATTSTLTASGTGSVTIKVHRSPWSLCAPYKVSFRRASFKGGVHVTAKTNVDAKFEGAWKYDKKLAQPSLGTLSFAIGPVPVSINFSAPIHAGVEVAAKATLKLERGATARALLDYSCTSGGCAGSKSATFSWSGGPAPSAAVSAKVDVTPYAYAGVHANLYTDWIANAEIGVKAKLTGELWGYSGNTCGDGDFDGTNEFVTAAALDTRLGIDLVAKAGVVGKSFGPWTWNLLDKHLAFFDLGSSSASSAMAPMLNVKASPIGSTTALANGRMRPCWPWSDKMKYRVNYNDGTVEEFWESPQVMFGRTHAYGSYGTKVVGVTAVIDEEGRTPGKTTTDSVSLRPVVFDPNLATMVMTASP